MKLSNNAITSWDKVGYEQCHLPHRPEQRDYALTVLCGKLSDLSRKTTEPLATVRLADDGRRTPVMLRWGLIPSWAKDPKIDNSLINARGETIISAKMTRRAQVFKEPGFS